MSIPVTCPACKASFRVKDEWAGKKGKCPQCKAALEVPGQPQPGPEEVPEVLAAPVEAAASATLSRRVDETRQPTVKTAPLPPAPDASVPQRPRSPAQLPRLEEPKPAAEKG